MKFALYDSQEELVDVYFANRYSISMLARQTGKSTLCSRLFAFGMQCLILIKLF